MNRIEILTALETAQRALTEIVNNSNVGIKKIATLIKLKRELQKIIELDFALDNESEQTAIDFEIEK